MHHSCVVMDIHPLQSLSPGSSLGRNITQVSQKGSPKPHSGQRSPQHRKPPLSPGSSLQDRTRHISPLLSPQKSPLSPSFKSPLSPSCPPGSSPPQSPQNPRPPLSPTLVAQKYRTAASPLSGAPAQSTGEVEKMTDKLKELKKRKMLIWRLVSGVQGDDHATEQESDVQNSERTAGRVGLGHPLKWEGSELVDELAQQCSNLGSLCVSVASSPALTSCSEPPDLSSLTDFALDEPAPAVSGSAPPAPAVSGSAGNVDKPENVERAESTLNELPENSATVQNPNPEAVQKQEECASSYQSAQELLAVSNGDHGNPARVHEAARVNAINWDGRKLSECAEKTFEELIGSLPVKLQEEYGKRLKVAVKLEIEHEVRRREWMALEELTNKLRAMQSQMEAVVMENANLQMELLSKAKAHDAAKAEAHATEGMLRVELAVAHEKNSQMQIALDDLRIALVTAQKHMEEDRAQWEIAMQTYHHLMQGRTEFDDTEESVQPFREYPANWMKVFWKDQQRSPRLLKKVRFTPEAKHMMKEEEDTCNQLRADVGVARLQQHENNHHAKSNHDARLKHDVVENGHQDKLSPEVKPDTRILSKATVTFSTM